VEKEVIFAIQQQFDGNREMKGFLSFE